MKTKSFDKPLYLNLYNFNTSAAQDYPYVLTSPRSLEACRKAGYKPVELLYKSLQEYQDDLGADTSTQVFQLYADQEQERLSKLEKCRAIRQELMTQSGSLKENAPPLSSTDDQKRVKTLVPSTRKEKLDKENKSRSNKAAALKALENNHNTNSKCEDVVDTLYLNSETISTSHSTNKRQSTTTSESNSHRPSNTGNCKKIAGKYKNFSTAPHIQLHCGSSSSEISSTSSTSASIKPRRRKTRLASTHFGKSCSRTSIKNLQKICSLPSSASSHGANKHKTKRPNLNRKQNAHKYRITTNSDYNYTSRSSSTDSSATPLKRKQVSFSYMSTEDLYLSEHDRRILESMALKKEVERENDEFAYQAHQLWEQDREAREQQNNTEMAQWKELVAEKRRLENIENSRKMEEMKHSLRQSQQQLESRIRQKEERATKLRHAVQQRRMSEVVERSQSAAKRRAEAEAAHHQRELEAALWQKMLDEQQKLRPNHFQSKLV